VQELYSLLIAMKQGLPTSSYSEKWSAK